MVAFDEEDDEDGGRSRTGTMWSLFLSIIMFVGICCYLRYDGKREREEELEEERRQRSHAPSRTLPSGASNDEDRAAMRRALAESRKALARERLEFRKIVSHWGATIEHQPKGVETATSPSTTMKATGAACTKVTECSPSLSNVTDTSAALTAIETDQDDDDNGPPSMTPGEIAQDVGGDDEDGEEDPELSPKKSISQGQQSHRTFWSSVNFFQRVVALNSSGGVDCSAASNRQESCSICLETYKIGDSVARLKAPQPGETSSSSSTIVCHHWFHEDCILEWLQKKNNCPICRVDMLQEN